MFVWSVSSLPSLVAHLLLILIINDIFIELIEINFGTLHTHTGSPTHDIPTLTRQAIIITARADISALSPAKKRF